MGNFDKNKLEGLFKDFTRLDMIQNAFVEELGLEIIFIIKDYFPGLRITKDIKKNIDNYARGVLNFTQSVIDKDSSYPHFRKSDELDRLSQLVIKLEPKVESRLFESALLKASKKMMIDFNKDIYDLSSEGFLLLDRNVRYFTIDFIMGIEGIARKKSVSIFQKRA